MKTTAHFHICLSVWIVFKGWLYLSVCFFLGLVVRAGCVCLFVSLFVFFMFVSLFVCLLKLVVNAGCFCLFVYLRIGSEGWWLVWRAAAACLPLIIVNQRTGSWDGQNFQEKKTD